VIEESQRPADFSWYIPMSPAGGMPSHTASSIAIETVQFSHDLTINGHSETNCYIFGNGTFMKSDKFVAGGRRWYLRYYPNGCNSDHWGHFLLYHDHGADEDKVPEVSYNVSLLGPDGNPLQGFPRFSRN
jgi:speckle-type POZ protein